MQELEDELLIYNLQTHRAICLNQTAALVWQNCDGKSSVGEIKRRMEKELGKLVREELVLFAIDELNDKGLIENGEEISKEFEGLTRREIVRKVGFASLVALPIVSSIAVPKAASAQSCPPGTFLPGTRYSRCVNTLAGCSRICADQIITDVENCCSRSGRRANCFFSSIHPELGRIYNCDCLCN